MIFSYSKYKIYRSLWDEPTFLIGLHRVQFSHWVEFRQWLRCQNRMLARDYKHEYYYYIVKEITK